MNKKDFDLRVNVIQKTFNDMRKIKCSTPKHEREIGEDIYPGGDIFTTEDGEFIDLEFQIDDFDEDERMKPAPHDANREPIPEGKKPDPKEV